MRRPLLALFVVGCSGDQATVDAPTGGNVDAPRADARPPDSKPPPAWGAATLIETTNTGESSSPRVAIDSAGTAVVVWKQRDTIRGNIWANRFVPASGWGIATLAEMDNAIDVAEPRVTVNSAGTALAVWSQLGGTATTMWGNTFSAGGGWATSMQLKPTDGQISSAPQLAGNGNSAIAVWSLFDGTRTNIWANRYGVGSGWGIASLIEVDDTGPAERPQVAINATGSAFAVWQSSDGTRTNIWANRYLLASGWGSPTLIETNDAGNARDPQIVIDDAGDAIAVWSQNGGTNDNVWANRFTTTSWGAATQIETNSNGGDPQVAIKASGTGAGNAIVVWRASNGQTNKIWANEYLVGSGWGTALMIQPAGSADEMSPEVAIDAAGNAIAIWTHFNASGLGTNRYVPGTGWGTATTIPAGAVILPQLAVDSMGNAVAVWTQTDRNIWASTYR